MVEKYSKLKSATAAIIRRREDIDERLKKATKDLAQTELELNAAVETNQDDLAVVLIQRKNALATDVGRADGRPRDGQQGRRRGEDLAPERPGRRSGS